MPVLVSFFFKCEGTEYIENVSEVNFMIMEFTSHLANTSQNTKFSSSIKTGESSTEDTFLY